MELSSSILRDTPKRLAELRPELPSALQKILDHSLAKELTDRYSSARELREAIDRLRRELACGARAAPTSAAEASIAVLPFTNMSADSENEFFADGITEEIINALTQIEDLRVAARTSAFSFKGKHVDLHGLDPQYALPWSGLADARISLGFQGYEQPNAIMPQAKEAALRAVALDPMLGEGHSSLATIYLLYDWEWSKAEEEFLRALELSPRYVQNLGRYALHYLAGARGRYDEAIAIAKKAVEIDPLSSHARMILFNAYAFSGKADEAVRAATTVLELGPSFFAYICLNVAHVA
jgi:tetratricopeptide (TPR) repeat protein